MSSSYLLLLSLVSIIWLQSLNGTNTNFPSYSSQLKQQLSISQVQLNNLAFFSDAGKLLGFLSGIAGRGLSTPLGSAPAGNSICWINTVCYVVVIRNFPSNPQVPVGITTSYQGFSPKIYSDIVHAPFSSKPHKTVKAYLLLNSILPGIVSFIAAIVLRVGEIDVGSPRARSMKVGFFLLFVIALVTGIYSVISSLGLISSKISPLGGAIFTAGFLLVPLLVPIIELIIEILRKTDQDTGTRVSDFALEESGYVDRTENGLKEGDQDDREIREVGVKEEIGVKLLLQRLDFWLLFLVYLFGATLGMVFLNNLGQIAESRRYSGTTDFVSLCSSFVFFGRLIPSLLDYRFSRSKNIMINSGPAPLVLYMLLTSGAFFFLLLDKKMALYVSTGIIGACTGAITSVAVIITKELFGTKGFSTNYNLVIANIPLGSFAFGYVASRLYSKEGNGACMGMECYRTTFIIWGSLCAVGTFLALILFARTGEFYSKKLQNMNMNLLSSQMVTTLEM